MEQVKRVKLFVIEVNKGGTWEAECLYKGTLRDALEYVAGVYSDFGSRIKRVKTPAEAGEYSTKLVVVGEGEAQTEWVN
jgi:hypothetical protein